MTDTPPEPANPAPGIAETFNPALLMQILSSLSSLSPVNHPPELKLDTGNKGENWKIWKQMWTNYAILSKLSDKSAEYKLAKFLSTIGLDAMRVYNSMTFNTVEEKNDLAAVLEKFELFAVGEKNSTYERYIFNSTNQGDDTFDKFLTKLLNQAKNCEFWECLHDSIIRDRIILGISDAHLHKRLLAKDLTPDKCIRICKSLEVNDKRHKAISGSADNPETVQSSREERPETKDI